MSEVREQINDSRFGNWLNRGCSCLKVFVNYGGTVKCVVPCGHQSALIIPQCMETDFNTSDTCK